MNSSKGIAYKIISEICQSLAEFFIISFFPGMKPEVFKKDYIAVRHFADSFFHLRSDAVWKESHLFFEEALESFRHRREGVMLINPAFWSAKM